MESGPVCGDPLAIPYSICAFEDEKLNNRESIFLRTGNQLSQTHLLTFWGWVCVIFGLQEILDVPGVFGRLAPVKGKWLCFALWQLAKDFDLFMLQVGQGKPQSQQAGPWA